MERSGGEKLARESNKISLSGSKTNFKKRKSCLHMFFCNKYFGNPLSPGGGGNGSFTLVGYHLYDTPPS